MKEEINEWNIAITQTVKQTSDSLTWKTRTINPEVMIVPPENSISVLKQSFLFDKFAIDTSSANVRDVSSRQACHNWRKQLSEHNKPANRRTNEWFTHLSMLSPRERVGGRSWGGDFDIFFKKN